MGVESRTKFNPEHKGEPTQEKIGFVVLGSVTHQYVIVT